MAEHRKRVDAVIIGYGWTGAIMAWNGTMPGTRTPGSATAAAIWVATEGADRRRGVRPRALVSP